jgi:rhodanese-related sulfurtransferase
MLIIDTMPYEKSYKKNRIPGGIKAWMEADYPVERIR